MRSLLLFFNMAIFSIAIQNTAVARLFGMDLVLQITAKKGLLRRFSGYLVLNTTFGTLLSYWFGSLISSGPLEGYLRALVYFLSMFVVYLCIYSSLGLGISKEDPRNLRSLLAYATFNASVLGTILIACNSALTFAQSFGFGVGSGVGFLLAGLVVREGRQRLRSSQIAASFVGLPSILLYIAVLSMALCTLYGGALPF